VNPGEPPGSAFVRIQRQGNKVIDAWSRDGKMWTGRQREVDWDTMVKIGVVAESNLRVPAVVVFDHYSLTRGAK
jgi:regulation of enolase protein 1 (concanavalin A-like superfamily)